MIRRRRPVHEIPFSLDSFLDVVANVVGIIIRMILVVWVGARSYHTVQKYADQPAAKKEIIIDPATITDPLQRELALQRQRFAESENKLLDQLRLLEVAKTERADAEKRLAGLAGKKQQLSLERTALTERVASGAAKPVAFSLDELKRRRERLAEEIRTLEKLPPMSKMLRYHTPVSKPVHTEEFFFECREGRVAFIDIASMLVEIKHEVPEKAKILQTTWQTSDVTNPVGAFRLRYTISRQRGALDGAVPGAGPNEREHFSYGLEEWEVEPMTPNRGEPTAKALAKTSEFRNIVDTLDAHQAVVTFWVYPDSFETFRQLRDYLYERDIVVAGRPLPDNTPIKSSRSGTVSRGQ